MKRSRGFTLLESLVASSMFLLMSASLFMIFRTGASVWLKSDANAEVLGRLQTLSARIGREAENSLFDSLAIASKNTPRVQHGCSFLSARNNEGQLDFHPSQLLPDWKRALVFYFDKAERRVYRRDTLLGQPNTLENLRHYSQAYQATDPTVVLTDHFANGIPIANDIENVVFSAPSRSIALSEGRGVKDIPLRQLQIEVTVKKSHYGTTKEANLTSRTVYFFRN